MKITEIYDQEHGHLYNYLKGGFDPYDYYYVVGEWLHKEYGTVQNMNDELDGELDTEFDTSINLKDIDPEEAIEIYEKLPQFAQKECQEYCRDYLLQNDPASSPSYDHMDVYKRIPRTTWLIHFSDSADDIHRNGFKYGFDDMTKLGLTTYYKTGTKHGPKSGEGWNFAFKALSRDALGAMNNKKYGRNAVMFQSSGVEVHHHGDDETQIIFQGNTVNPRNIIYLENDGGDWCVMPRRGNRPVFKDQDGDFEAAVKWVIQNYAQYRNVL